MLFMGISLCYYWGHDQHAWASRNHGTAVAFRCENGDCIIRTWSVGISDWKRCAASLSDAMAVGPLWLTPA